MTIWLGVFGGALGWFSRRLDLTLPSKFTLLVKEGKRKENLTMTE